MLPLLLAVAVAGGGIGSTPAGAAQQCGATASFCPAAMPVCSSVFTFPRHLHIFCCTEIGGVRVRILPIAAVFPPQTANPLDRPYRIPLPIPSMQCCAAQYSPTGFGCAVSVSADARLAAACGSLPGDLSPTEAVHCCKMGPAFPPSTTLPNVLVIGDSVSIG